MEDSTGRGARLDELAKKAPDHRSGPASDFPSDMRKFRSSPEPDGISPHEFPPASRPSDDELSPSDRSGEQLPATCLMPNQLSPAELYGADVTCFGRFDIVRLLGRGGMGSVFLAFDPTLNRRVALKIPHPGGFVDPEIRERFLREGRAAGSIRHPGIVPVYECGREGNVCYLVAEFCDGPTLGQWLADQTAPVPLRLAAVLVVQLAESVHHAHSCGIIHRDLKPGNVLLDRYHDAAHGALSSDSTAYPKLPFVPRITDFGLAQVLQDDSELTRTGMAIGTAAYMAPEQAAGHRDQTGPWTDVYALGAILYELMAGRPPFGRGSTAAVLCAVQENEPPALRRQRNMPRDLEAICLKCLEKNPAKRYPSAAALRDDLLRFLRDEPTNARPVTAPERLFRWAKRSPSQAILLALSLLTLVGLVVGLSIHSRQLSVALTDTRKARDEAKRQSLRAEQESRRREVERLRAESGEQHARELLYISDMSRAVRAWREKDHLAVLELLDEHAPRPGEPDLRGFEWHFLKASCTPQPLTEFTHGDPIRHCVVTGDQRRLITAGDDHAIRVWELESGRLESTLTGHAGIVREVAVSPDGRFLVSVSDDHFVLLWDLEQLAFQRALGIHTTGIETVTWSPNGQWVVTGARYSDVRVWSLEQGLVLAIPDDGRHESLVFSPDSRYLYLPGKYQLKVWDLQEQVQVRVLDPYAGVSGMRAMCSLAGGSLLAGTTRFDPLITIHRPDDAQPLGLLKGDCRYSNGFAVSPDGQWLASAGTEGVVRLFDVSRYGTRQPDHSPAGFLLKQGIATTIVAHPTAATSVQFVDEQRLVTTGEDGTARLWDLTRLADWRRCGPPGHAKRVTVWNGDQALVVGDDAKAPLVVTPDGPTSDEPSGYSRCGIPSPDGRWFATSLSDGDVALWDAETQQIVGRLTLPASDSRIVYSQAFSPDGRALAVGYKDGTLGLWNVLNQEVIDQKRVVGSCYCVRFSHHGEYLAVGDDQGFDIWSHPEGELVRHVDFEPRSVVALAWSPQDDRLAIATDDSHICMYGTEDWQEHYQVTTRQDADCLEFFHDGRTLLAGDSAGHITLWHVRTGRPIGLLYESPWPEEFILDFAFPADGRFLAAATQQTSAASILVSRGFGNR